MASERFSTRGQCCVGDCEVALIVREEEGGPWIKLFTCKHKLASLSDYFNKLLCGNFKEKNKKEVTIWDVTKIQMVPFIRWLSKYPKRVRVIDSDSLCSLIFLADRFLCPKLEKQILKVINSLYSNYGYGHWLGSYTGNSSGEESNDDDNSEVEEFGTDAKFKLLEVAENHKGTGANILEACIRHCGDLEIDQVAPLHGRVSTGTLAAIYATIGRAKDVTLSKIKSVNGGPCCKRARMTLEPIRSCDLRKIKIDKDLFST